MASKDKRIDDFDEANAQALADMLSDFHTSEPVRLQIINDILDASKDENFFATMYAEELTLGRCDGCGHENHWGIPEDDLNQMGWVTHKKDSRVLKNTVLKDCEEYMEACAKKKTTI